ncbi:hypothetical protein HanRHA438_Chr11g0501871 [Helianthus annuus]|uniref:Uncharacterized protein n=1 Tax=Helianthus annuus TaxID=4232 RepID=A0A251TBA3_HELAN|nr:hypothetical protein HanXRQr2_Chr11g0489101 [Helianthus annuus]KAF5781888.1 hypothetical protein HanXRQr2_Chr11g0489121 [Helianthus annuus]KAJ0501434.1 hypothetical protein HanHA300_Chr11g0400751 [Helianthus annuus]KAJ0501436.1 hypothetical protein HanHA300_Chr11g0400771 [Helianthus annuus]KAJ0509234.1 hypothetical protein HanIR_Chr11g0526531 [Helianthus annuus]
MENHFTAALPSSEILPLQFSMQFSDLIGGPIIDQIECPCMGMDHSMLTVHRSASIFLSVMLFG